jgi:hypothetical protein
MLRLLNNCGALGPLCPFQRFFRDLSTVEKKNPCGSSSPHVHRGQKVEYTVQKCTYHLPFYRGLLLNADGLTAPQSRLRGTPIKIVQRLRVPTSQSCTPAAFTSSKCTSDPTEAYQRHVITTYSFLMYLSIQTLERNFKMPMQAQ